MSTYLCVDAVDVSMCGCLWIPEEDIKSHGDGITDVCEHGYWEMNTDPLQKQQVLLTPESFSAPKVMRNHIEYVNCLFQMKIK